MAAKPPDAFLSYTRFDDRHDGGAISEFCRRLASAVQTVTGIPFEIFQDVGGIGIGEHWPGELDRMLDEARFFIPMLTPSYFTSKPCRDELEKFLRAEAERERHDLVLPIYYIESEVLEDEDLRAADLLASTLHERQRRDWRELRFEPFEAANVRRALERLAQEIVKARRGPMAPRSIPQPGATALTSRGTSVSPAANSVEPQQTGESSKSTPFSLTPGTVLRDKDAPWCPELVVIPAGEFMIGSTEAEREWAIKQGVPREMAESEKPQHLVRIAYPLAVGRFPVTVDEYGHFARTTGRAQPGDEDWGSGRRPVTNVDWKDANPSLTGSRCRPASNTVCCPRRSGSTPAGAGTTTRYWWGDEITFKNALYGLNWVGRATEVGIYPANPFGLYDMTGNIPEWVEDCWNHTYEGEGRPDDGSAWTAGDCRTRVLRGGSCCDSPGDLRSASRNGTVTGLANPLGGFRVARELPAQPAGNPLKDTHWSKLEYHDQKLAGRVTFDYSTTMAYIQSGEMNSFSKPN
jgi:formylglycine-generating enzyme required for sulfatase activity